MEEMSANDADLLAPHIGQFTTKNSSLPLRFFNGFLGGRYESNNANFKYYVSIIPTAGHVLHRKIKGNTNLTQSAAFNCFMMDPSCLNAMKLDEEYWLDDTAYAFPDDQVFFYKAYRLGLKVMHCNAPFICHLDHGSSAPDRRKKAAFANGRNFLIFWHRFLWKPLDNAGQRLLYLCGITYRCLAHIAFNSLLSIVKRRNTLTPYLKGIRSGLSYIKSDKYKALDTIPRK